METHGANVFCKAPAAKLLGEEDIAHEAQTVAETGTETAYEGTAKELAKGKPVHLTHGSHGKNGREAVDGNTATNWGSRSCTHTNNANKPWWRVDLVESFQIKVGCHPFL